MHSERLLAVTHSDYVGVFVTVQVSECHQVGPCLLMQERLSQSHVHLIQAYTRISDRRWDIPSGGSSQKSSLLKWSRRQPSTEIVPLIGGGRSLDSPRLNRKKRAARDIKKFI